MSIPFAHETWFDHAPYPTDWGFAGETLTLALLAGAVLVALIVRLVARFAPRPEGVTVSDRHTAPGLLPVFGAATIIATIAICLVIAFPSTATVIVALTTVIGFAAALVMVLSRLIGPEAHQVQNAVVPPAAVNVAGALAPEQRARVLHQATRGARGRRVHMHAPPPDRPGHSVPILTTLSIRTPPFGL
jgi:MFS family permease